MLPESIKNTYEELKGQFVITNCWKIERLVGIGTDEEDYYWLTYNGRELKWNTCVGGLKRLKNKLDAKDYNELVRIAKLNHHDQFEGIREKVIQELYNLKGDDKILEGLYMEIV